MVATKAYNCDGIDGLAWEHEPVPSSGETTARFSFLIKHGTRRMVLSRWQYKDDHRLCVKEMPQTAQLCAKGPFDFLIEKPIRAKTKE